MPNTWLFSSLYCCWIRDVSTQMSRSAVAVVAVVLLSVCAPKTSEAFVSTNLALPPMFLRTHGIEGVCVCVRARVCVCVRARVWVCLCMATLFLFVAQWRCCSVYLSHTHTRTDTHTPLDCSLTLSTCLTHVHTSIHTCIHAYIHIWTRFHTQHIHTHTHTHMSTFVYIHVCIHTCLYTYMFVYTHTYTHTYVAFCRICKYIWHDSFIRDMTHSYVWHDAFIHVTWRIQTCDMIHSNMYHDSFIHVTWLIHICDTTRSLSKKNWHASWSNLIWDGYHEYAP